MPDRPIFHLGVLPNIQPELLAPSKKSKNNDESDDEDYSAGKGRGKSTPKTGKGKGKSIVKNSVEYEETQESD